MIEYIPETDYLKGVRILISAHYVPGGVASLLLKRMGAEILKVEPPGGEMARKVPPFVEIDGVRTTTYFHAFNAGIECIELNLKTEDGKEHLRSLIPNYEVLIDGNRAGFLESMIGQPIHALNPEIMHIPITAFGLSGPMKDLAGHDGNSMAVSGALSYGRTDEKGLPALPGFQAADIISGMFATMMTVGKIAGKFNPQSEVKVPTYDASMLKGGQFLNHMYLVEEQLAGSSPQKNAGLLNGGLANYRVYACADGKHVFLGALETKLFGNFCAKLERADLLPLAFVQNEKLNQALEELFKTRSRDEWIDLFQGVDCALSPVLELKEVL